LGCRVINATSLFHTHTPSLLKDWSVALTN
jgi:hypothetical protein